MILKGDNYYSYMYYLSVTSLHVEQTLCLVLMAIETERTVYKP